MRGKLTPRQSMSKLALIGFFALGIGSAAIPAVAVAHVSAREAGVDHRPSGWAPAREVENSANRPSLTTDVEQLEGNHNSQLWLGYALIGGAVLALAFGLTTAAQSPQRAPGRRGSNTDPANGRAMAGTRAGP